MARSRTTALPRGQRRISLAPWARYFEENQSSRWRKSTLNVVSEP